MDFTVEEINLMCAFDISSKPLLVKELTETLPELVSEGLHELAEQVIARLEKMSDEAFDAAKDTFFPEYGDYDDESYTEYEP